MIYSAKLNIDYIPFVDVDLSKILRRHVRLDLERNVDPNLVNMLTNLGLTVGHAEVFYSCPGFTSSVAHIDGQSPKYMWESRVKLNYILGGSASTMSWHDIGSDEFCKSFSNSLIGTQYVSYDLNQCSTVHSANLSGWNLVETGVPHSIQNLGSDPRYCLSLFIREHRSWIGFSRALELFGQLVM